MQTREFCSNAVASLFELVFYMLYVSPFFQCIFLYYYFLENACIYLHKNHRHPCSFLLYSFPKKIITVNWFFSRNLITYETNPAQYERMRYLNYREMCTRVQQNISFLDSGTNKCRFIQNCEGEKRKRRARMFLREKVLLLDMIGDM